MSQVSGLESQVKNGFDLRLATCDLRQSFDLATEASHAD